MPLTPAQQKIIAKSGGPPVDGGTSYGTVKELRQDLRNAIRSGETSRDIMQNVKATLDDYFYKRITVSVAQHGEWIEIGGRRVQPVGLLDYEYVIEDFIDKIHSVLRELNWGQPQ